MLEYRISQVPAPADAEAEDLALVCNGLSYENVAHNPSWRLDIARKFEEHEGTIDIHGRP